MGEGDGTVSLLSLGAMCVEGWKRARWNPAGIKVTTIEVPSGQRIQPKGRGYSYFLSPLFSYPTNQLGVFPVAEGIQQTTSTS